MIYLDYSATTKPEKEVLDTFVKVSNDFPGNPNSLHKLGLESNRLIDAATEKIASYLGVKKNEIIYTSGATESNNAAIYGVLNKYNERGKEVITTNLEHSSINENIDYIEKLGYKIIYVNTINGKVDLDDLKNKLNNNTILVTIASVNSETGVHQDIDEIGKIIKEYPRCIFHSDITQSVGKVKENLKNVDLASFSAQKFYGLKGIGCLIKKENIELIPLIKGGKSTTIYRAGTPSPALIASLSKALHLAHTNLEKNYDYVKELNSYLRNSLKEIDKVHINSPENAIPHILNISIEGIKPETVMHALEEKDIYISTKTACSKDNDYSKAVYELTNNIDYAKHSIRLSLSYKTTKEELNIFINELKKIIKSLSI